MIERFNVTEVHQVISPGVTRVIDVPMMRDPEGQWVRYEDIKHLLRDTVEADKATGDT